MKLDKRFILAASLVMGLGLGVSACGGDDGNDDEKKANGEACTVNSDCTSDYCSAGKCAAKPAENKCDKTAADCSKDHQHLDSDACACKCDAGYKLDGDACVVDEENKCDKTEADCNAETETWNAAECKCDPKQTEACTLTCDGEHQELDSEACACKCAMGYHFNKAETPVCEEDITASESCNDGNVDEDEVCDSKDNSIKFKADYGTCVNYYAENGETLTSEQVTGTPSCGNTCKTLAKGTCAKVDDTCGNGKLDEGEFCDEVVEGDSKVIKFADDAAATCENANQGKFGKPGCNKTCDGYSKGSCSETEADTCKATVAYDEATKKATSTVTASNSDAKTAVICASKNAKLDALVAKTVELKASNEFDASSLTDAGDYVCYVVYMDKDNNRSFCSKDGAIIKLTDATADNAGIATFTVASSVAAGVLSKWTFVSADKATIAAKMTEGVAADEGDKNILMSYVDNGKTGITVTLTADNGGNNALTALQIKVDAKEKLGDTQKEDESAHISIGSLDTYTVTGLKMTAKYEGGKIYVTAVDGASEVIVKTIDDMTKDYAEKTVSGFAANISKINIYGDNDAAKAMAIDDLTIEGAAK